MRVDLERSLSTQARLMVHTRQSSGTIPGSRVLVNSILDSYSLVRRRSVVIGDAAEGEDVLSLQTGCCSGRARSECQESLRLNGQNYAGHQRLEKAT